MNYIEAAEILGFNSLELMKSFCPGIIREKANLDFDIDYARDYCCSVDTRDADGYYSCVRRCWGQEITARFQEYVNALNDVV